jgi:hypothetical protein
METPTRREIILKKYKEFYDEFNDLSKKSLINYEFSSFKFLPNLDEIDNKLSEFLLLLPQHFGLDKEKNYESFKILLIYYQIKLEKPLKYEIFEIVNKFIIFVLNMT